MSYMRRLNSTSASNSRRKRHPLLLQPFTNWPKQCEYDALREDLIRDRITVGISDTKLFEKLQMIADLTLEKAITTVRQVEQAHQQQGIF